MKGGGRLLWIAMLLMLTTLWSAPASAQAGIVGAQVAVCVRPVTPGDTVRGVLATPDRFDCTTDQTRFGPGDFWVLSTTLHDTASADRAIHVRQTSLWQDGLALYAVYADGRIIGTRNDGAGVGAHLRLGAVVDHRLAPRGVPVERLLWRIDNASNLRGIVVGARIADDAQFVRSDLFLAAVYSAFVGLSVALMIYNLALWKALRHRFQIAYCAMLFGLTIYALSSSGVLAWIAPDMPNNHRITLNYVALCWATAAALLFSRHFFEARLFDGWLSRAIDVTVGLFLVMGTAFLAFAPIAIRLLDRIYSILFIAVPLVVVPILWRAWRRRSNFLWLFSLTWASPMVMVITRGLYNLNLIPWSFWLDNSTLLAMSAEALLTSLAIAYRFRLLSRERDEALRQEAISRELADTDPLTGLLNRRAFLAQALADGRPRTLMLFDIDHFKLVNDTIGHDGGDEVLRLFALTLRDHAGGGLLARMGGEEFALLCDPATMPDPDQLLAAVRSQRMPFDLRVTTSIGIGHGPLATDRDWKTLYRLTDQALLQAKAGGRDGVRRASGVVRAA